MRSVEYFPFLAATWLQINLETWFLAHLAWFQVQNVAKHEIYLGSYAPKWVAGKHSFGYHFQITISTRPGITHWGPADLSRILARKRIGDLKPLCLLSVSLCFLSVTSMSLCFALHSFIAVSLHLPLFFLSFSVIFTFFHSPSDATQTTSTWRS